MLYNDYVWRLSSTSPLEIDIQLPKDLEWVDEFTWSPVRQTISETLTGALIVQESKLKKGKPITLQGKDDMGWITRLTAETLMQMRDSIGLVMSIQYVHWNGSIYGDILHDFDVMFRHYESPAIELESVLRFNGFEPEAWYKVRGLKFMEVDLNVASPCS
ncbi:hypothetical protein GW916_09365 [bacterium]|nr:hypothetical protein [bacterium]